MVATTVRGLYSSGLVALFMTPSRVPERKREIVAAATILADDLFNANNVASCGTSVGDRCAVPLWQDVLCNAWCTSAPPPHLPCYASSQVKTTTRAGSGRAC